MNQVLFAVVLGLITAGAIGFMLSKLLEKRRTRGSSRIVLWDGDTNAWDVRYATPVGNEVTLKVGDKDRTYILPAKGRIPADKPTWLIHPIHGFSYVPPADKDTVNADDLMMKLAVANPESYHFAMARNRPRDSLAANVQEEGWTKHLPLLMTIGAVTLVVILGCLAWIISHMKGAA